MLAAWRGAGRVYINDLSAERLATCKAIDPAFLTVEGDIKEVIAGTPGARGVQVCITACPSPGGAGDGAAGLREQRADKFLRRRACPTGSRCRWTPISSTISS